MADFTQKELDDILAKDPDGFNVIAALQKRKEDKKREQQLSGKNFDNLTNKQFADIKAFLEEPVNPNLISYDINVMIKDAMEALTADDKDAFLRRVLVLLRTLKVANGV